MGNGWMLMNAQALEMLLAQLLLVLLVAGMLRARAQGKIAWLWQDAPSRICLNERGLLLTAGLSALVFCGMTVAVLHSHLSQPAHGLMAWDLAVQRWAGAVLSPGWVPWIRAWTTLGNVEVMAAMSILAGLWLLWRRQGLQFWALALAAGGIGLWIRGIKVAVQRARPAGGLVNEESFSFPSGHSAGTAAIFGILAWLVMRHTPPRWHGWVCAAAALGALGIALSRVLLSVHFASDVLAGLCLGLCWLMLVLWGIHRVEQKPLASGR